MILFFATKHLCRTIRSFLFSSVCFSDFRLSPPLPPVNLCEISSKFLGFSNSFKYCLASCVSNFICRGCTRVATFKQDCCQWILSGTTVNQLSFIIYTCIHLPLILYLECCLSYRFAFSCVWQLTSDAQIVSTEFFKSVISSKVERKNKLKFNVKNILSSALI